MNEPSLSPVSHPRTPFDVDALMSELADEVAARDASGGIIPSFAEEFTGFGARDFFAITPEVHGSTKAVVGPVVTRGKRMAARAAEPMVAGLAEQVAASLGEIRMILDDLLEEQERMKDSLASLRRDIVALENSGAEVRDPS